MIGSLTLRDAGEGSLHELLSSCKLAALAIVFESSVFECRAEAGVSDTKDQIRLSGRTHERHRPDRGSCRRLADAKGELYSNGGGSEPFFAITGQTHN
jgi:hypothetical protein